MVKITEELIKAYALKNAIAHEGKVNQGSVISGLFSEGLEKNKVKEIMPLVNKVIREISKLSLEEQEKEFSRLENLVGHREERQGLPELPNVPKTGLIMRYRPSPSGPLHLGHIISIMPSSLYVKKYGGKFYVVVDDTDPETALKEAYADIKKDCDWIFGNVFKYINSSDRMEIYYSFAEKLINKNSAYVCTCSSEKFKGFSELQEDCPCRNNELKENIYRWNKMLDKKGFGEGQAVLRFKTPEKYSGMKNSNPAMRDFPLARINLNKHPLQGLKYRVWPLMNLVVSVDDMEFGMTHIIRGKDHMDNAKRQEMIFEVFGKKYPWCFFIGRIKFNDLVLSKRKLKEAIGKGEFSGADDEKLATISALRKRGYKPSAFEKLIEQRGLSEVDKVMSQKDFFQLLDEFNRQK